MVDRTGVELRRERVGDAEAVVAIPAAWPPRYAVLVLTGSSGRIDEPRVRFLASAGAVAVGLQWFGGEGQPPGICEVPLESFTPALDLLAGYGAPLAVLGTSKGAEAACLLALTDPRLSAVVAFAPTDVVWANIGAGRDGRAEPPRSSWTRAGQPLPFVPLASGWTATDDPPAYLGWYLQSRRVYVDRVQLATIPLERSGPCHSLRVLTTDRPRGAMTDTARGSKRLFWVWVVVMALALAGLVLDDDRDWASWLGVGQALLGGTLAVLHLRSWRILSRSDSARSR